MRRVAEVMAQRGQKLCPTVSRSSTASTDTVEIDKQLVEYVFTRIQANYGQMWTARVTSTEIFQLMVVDWGMALRPFDIATIDRALERCRVAYPKCPTMSEFLAECRASRRPLIHRALPKPKADQAKGKLEVSVMRRLLGVGA